MSEFPHLFTAIDHVGVAVADLDAAKLFYERTFGMRLVHEEGLENCWARHLLNHRALRAGLAAIGIRYSTAEGAILPQLNAVFVPEGVDDAAVRGQLLARFGIEIGAGLGAYKGKVWRIGLMGETSTPANVFNLLSWLQRLLSRAGAKVGSGLEAAQAALR